MANRFLPDLEEPNSSLPKILTIPSIWMHILSFVNTLANSFGVNGPRRGGNAIGGSMIIIEPLPPAAPER